MGAFFLLGGTVLFLTGLGCLLIVFVSIARRVRANRSSSIYFRNKPSYRDGVLTGLGIFLIIAAQGFYWFHGEVSQFIPFDESVPQIQVSFLYEEERTPRIVLQSIDQNHQLGAQLIPIMGDRAVIGVEVISWKQIFKILGLKDCYHINGIYFQAPDSIIEASLSRLPDYSLNGGPSGFTSLVNTLGNAFPAQMRLLISEPFSADQKHHYIVGISPDSISSALTIDNKPTASYSN